MQMITDDYICIGRIGKPHGIHGEVWVALMTDFPDRFEELEEVQVEGRGGPAACRIESARSRNGRVILKFTHIGTREEAAMLRGSLIRIPRGEAQPLEDDAYYIFDLVGCSVTDSRHGMLGSVDDVMTETGNDLLVVKDGTGREVLIPMVAAMIDTVDIGARRIAVTLPEGLVE